MKIVNKFMLIPGETRTNLKLVDTGIDLTTDINEPGAEIGEEVLQRMEKELLDKLQTGDVLVLSGSVPVNVPSDIYKRWIERTRQRGVRTILDADNELLRCGIEANPYIIKPNSRELTQLLGAKLISREDIAAAVKNWLADKKIHGVLVSCGEEGAVYVSGKDCYIADAITVKVRSTVGAGDAMVAVLAYALENGLDEQEMLKLAVAAGTASVLTEGTEPPDGQEIMKLKQLVEVHKYNEV